MPEVQRSSDVVETHAERALTFGICGVVAIVLGGVMIYYQGMLLYLGYLLVLGGLAAAITAAYWGLQIRKVESVQTICPYCQKKNSLTVAPSRDFACTYCHRMIPVENGRILKVFQVRCGFCNALNFYSEKAQGLLCESCDRVIPIATADGEQAKSFATYARQDDERLYDLILIAQGHKTEELISALQHMLALNRNQVKQMLTELPVTLLTGITRKKAEMLTAQLALHEGAAEFRETQTT